MSLDLGELRASVVVDQSQVASGLASLRRKVSDFTRQLGSDTDRAGMEAGRQLAEGVTRGADGKFRDARGKFVGVGKAFADGINDGLREQFPRGLSSVRERVLTWGSRLASEGKKIGRGVGGGIVDGVKSGTSMLGGVTRTGLGILTRFSAGGALALTGLAAAAAGIGGAVASSNEQATISFSTMLRKAGDTQDQAEKRAHDFIGRLQKLAATTPFEFADLQDYSGKLVSAGIDAEKIIPIMKNLGDVTSGVGTGKEGIDRATVALQQMIAAQKISAEDLNQLRDAGIPVYDLLAGATGKSKKEIVDLANKGKLGKKELDALLTTLSSDTPKGLERFSGLMSKQSTSLKGMWSNLSDTVSQGLGRVGEKAMPQLKSGLGGVQRLVSQVFDYLDDHGDDISRIFESGGRTLRAFGGIIRPVMKAFTGGLTDGQDVLTSLADWMDTHQESMTEFFTGAASAAIGFGKVAATVVSGVLHAYVGLQKGIQAILEFILSKTQAALSIAAAGADAVGAKGTADKLTGAAGAIQTMRDNNAKNSSGADAAQAIADGIDDKLLPALSRADRALEKNGKKAQDNAREGDSWRRSLLGITRAVDENGHSLSDHTKKGKANRKAIEDSVRAMNDDAQAAYDAKAAKGDLAGAEKAAAKVIRNGTGDIKDQAKKAGLNKGAVDDLIGSVRKIPKTHSTAINFSTNAGKVLVALKVRTSAGGNEDGTTAPGFGGDGKGRARGGLLPGRTPLSRGDDMALPLAGGGWQPLRGGEGVQVTEAMDDYEKVRLHTMNHGVLAGMSPARVRGLLGETDGKAKGGMIGRSAVPASVKELGPAATAFAERNAAAAAQAYATATKKTLQGALTAARSGGDVGKALQYARAHEGHPYVYGTLWDCSGLVSALVSIAKGKEPRRLFSTTAFHGASAAGFTRGKNSNFKVGVNPNPGKSGHMVAELNGVAVEEAGGVGLRVGGSARKVTDPMFSWRGGLARGGLAGDMPYDLVDPRGQHYSPMLADLAKAIESRRGYATGTRGARAGFNWTAEKAAELVVNPQLRHYSGGERVLSPEQTRAALGGAGGGPAIGTVNITTRDGSTRDGLNQLHFKVRSIHLGRKGP